MLNDLLSVSQWGGPSGSSGARTRSFSYDSLSRLLSAVNAESGTLSYTYDQNGNVLTRTDARAVITTYVYDPLNRLLSKVYSDLNTPSSCFQYDSTATNGVGHLANEWTQRYAIGPCPATAPTTGFLTKRSLLAYDSMGRLWSEQQCTQAGCNLATPCSTAGGNQSYSYDAAGDLLCSSNGIASTPGVGSAPLTFAQTVDAVGRLSTKTSNWSTFPTNLFTIGQTNGYNPAGDLGNWTLGPNLSVVQGYTNRFWINSITATGQLP
jgi:YD repeat-containing protein